MLRNGAAAWSWSWSTSVRRTRGMVDLGMHRYADLDGTT